MHTTTCTIMCKGRFNHTELSRSAHLLSARSKHKKEGGGHYAAGTMAFSKWTDVSLFTQD